MVEMLNLVPVEMTLEALDLWEAFSAFVGLLP